MGARFVARDGLPIFLFSFCLYSGMWISKSIHPLWFKQNDALYSFGISYSVMAATGASSVLIGRIINRISLRNALLFGSCCYAIGMAMRIFTSVPLAVMSGFIAGIGASVTLICLSSWSFEGSSEDHRERLYSYSLWASNIARGGVVMIAGLMIGTIAILTDLRLLLLLSALFPLVGFALCYNNIPDTRKPASQERNGASCLIPQDKIIILYFSAYSFASGLLVSFILPYLPVLLSNAGMSEANILITLGFASLVVVVTQPTLLRMGQNIGMPIFFSGAIIVLAASTAALILDKSLWLFVLFVTVRFVAANSVLIAQRSIEMRVIERSKAAANMGALQGAFLFGDMFGGTAAGFAWAHGQTDIVFAFVGLALIINGSFFLWAYKSTITRKAIPDAL